MFLTSYRLLNLILLSLITTSRVLPRTWDPAFSLSLTNTTKLIVMVTRFRSGSTFLGEVFNNNAEVLYDFESFHSLPARKGRGLFLGGEPRHSDEELNMLHVQQILHNCSILMSPFLNVMHKHWRCPSTKEQVRELYGEEGCDESQGAWKGPSTLKIRQYLCRKRDAVALKVIRIRRIRDLELIKNIDKADIKIVHLIRDPRAMFRSRSGFKEIFGGRRNTLIWNLNNNLEKVNKLALEAHTECEEYLSDIKYAERTPWLKGRYLKVVHDQLGVDPVGTARSIYKFVGLSMPDEVMEYLTLLTQTDNRVETSNAEQLKNDMGSGGALNTIRNSTAVNEKWLGWKIPLIRNVDTQCSRFIDLMGWPYVLDNDNKYSAYHPYRAY